MSARIVLGCALLAACSPAPRTQVMAFIRVEPGVMSRAERLEVVVRGGAPGEPREERERLFFASPRGGEGHALSWPVQVALVPDGRDASRTFEIIATVEDETGAFARTRVQSGFLSGETLALDVWLRDDCVGQLCDESESCIDGRCAPLRMVEACSLSQLDGGVASCAPADGGAGADAGSDGGVTDVDAGRDAGPSDAGPADPLDVHNAIFVTSRTYVLGDLGGIAGADAICQTHAGEAGLPEADGYRALLPTASESAIARLGAARGWVRMDGLPFADRVEDLEAGRVLYPVLLTETGARATVPPGRGVASALNGDLTQHLGNCMDWSSREGFLHAFGDPRDGTGRWLRTDGGPFGCHESMPIYCVGTARSEPLTPPVAPEGAGLAFVTRDTVAPGMGVAAFDALCAAEAPAGGPTYRALVAPAEGVTAMSRFAFVGPWARADGVLVAEGPSDIETQRLRSAIAVTADGARYLDAVIWTGADGPGSTRTRTCMDWMDPTRDTGSAGRSGSTVAFFFATPTNVLCGASNRVLCLSDGAL